MHQIFSDFRFYLSIALMISGFILFKVVNKSFAKQKSRLEDPQKNFEKFQKEMREKGIRVRSHTSVWLIVPVFITVLGIIGLIVTFTKY